MKSHKANVDELVNAVAGASNDGRHQYWAEVITVMPAAEALVK